MYEKEKHLNFSNLIQKHHCCIEPQVCFESNAFYGEVATIWICPFLSVHIFVGANTEGHINYENIQRLFDVQDASLSILIHKPFVFFSREMKKCDNHSVFFEMERPSPSLKSQSFESVNNHDTYIASV